MMAVALAHEGAFGFALQTEKGTFVTPDNWLPLMDGGHGAADTVALRKNYAPLDLADMRAYQTEYFSPGQWVEGALRFPLVPGALSDLLDWIQARDDDNQGQWASAVIDCAHAVKKITDLKVRRAILDCVVGEPVLCTLEVVGLTMEAGTTPTVAMPTEPPYLFREATVELAVGGTPGLDGNCERLRVVVDTCLEEPEKGLRLTPSSGPMELYNLAGLRAWGSLSRDFVDSAVYADFLAGTEAALTVTLQRGAAAAEISLPRLVHVTDALGLPGSHERRIVEEVEFLALGSDDGTTPPVVLS
jgi:hypothetical protein